MPSGGRRPAPRRAPYVAPATPLALQVASLWEELFETGPLGLADDFFALGGDSLLALRMIEGVRGRLGLELPLDSLLEGATVAHVADVLSRAAPGAGAPLMRFRPGRGRPPLVLIHPAGGSALCYLELARALPARQPVFGLQEPPEVRDRAPSVEERAAAYLDLLRAALPGGPWHLAGLSFGGLVAFEIARRLAAGGGRPGVVALFDTTAPLLDGARVEDDTVGRLADILDRSRLDDVAPDPEDERRMWAALAALAGERVTASAHEARPGAATRLGEIERFCRSHHFFPAGGEMGYVELRRFLRSMQAAFRSARRYAPGPYPGRVLLFQAGQSPGGTRAGLEAWNLAQAQRWQTLVGGGLEVDAAPGSHFDLLGPPHAEALASRLAEALDRASAAPEP